jgi:hypothetical protein
MKKIRVWFPHGRCPSSKVFLDFLENSEDPFRSERTRAHVSICPHCREKLEMLKAIDKTLPEIPSAGLPATHSGTGEIRRLAGSKVKSLTYRSFFPATPAIAALLTFFALFVLIQPRIPDNLRGEEKNSVNLIEPGGVLQDLPDAFRWTPVKEADVYTFKLIDDQLDTLIEKTMLKHSKFPITKKLRAKLKKGTNYIWIVEVYDDEQNQMGTSRKHFRLCGEF